MAGIALYRLHHWFLFSRDRTEDERKAKRHASGRWNFAIAFDETTFTISLVRRMASGLSPATYLD